MDQTRSDWSQSAQSAKEPDHPLVLVASAQGGTRVMAMNPRARAVGVDIHQLLADARTLYPALIVKDYEPEGDANTLRQLALWLMRYCPWVTYDPPDGLLMDITGSVHLVGGEDALLNDIIMRFSEFGFSTRIAIADTIGCAHAVARYGQSPKSIITSVTSKHAMRSLPIESLRVGSDIADRLAQVGLTTVGSLYDKPRAPIAARYGDLLLTRLDQALGHKSESLVPLKEPPVYRNSARFLEPILHLESLEHHVVSLAAELMNMLKEAKKGAQRFELTLYRVDGVANDLIIGTHRHTNDTSLLVRLLSEKLKFFIETYDAGFGVEQISLAAYACEHLTIEQIGILSHGTSDRAASFDTLINRIANRFGSQAVGQLIPNESYIPERSEAYVAPDDKRLKTANWNAFLEKLQGDNHLGRPIMLLPKPEPITAIAEVPDGPPVLFEWRKLKCRIHAAEGPERIAPEWWARRSDAIERTRDYYRVEDMDGYRYWLFRCGLYEREEKPTWFMHGFFA
ncbi:DNA polymerase Y family protein [Kordiimonas sp. SCSIO 12610]|uniref:Y-family DNA polymerase n=1 Tax=Kordiimonas sp. SCSIO 12610 TaxID=2829597 RepID=UPI00210C6530|nr:DNA polymerase Y family protein [Kordiimonas sp. SCSIO 12610]UTW54816.1 DNA polymerase Y family protein [Kordiimonas sp. SCSIO 12610]